MGLQYTKVGEGAAYPNNTEPGQNVILPTADAVPPINAGVQPGDCAVYKWMIQPGAGPNDDEPAWTHSYHSYVDFQVSSVPSTIPRATAQPPLTLSLVGQ